MLLEEDRRWAEIAEAAARGDQTALDERGAFLAPRSAALRRFLADPPNGILQGAHLIQEPDYREAFLTHFGTFLTDSTTARRHMLNTLRMDLQMLEREEAVLDTAQWHARWNPLLTMLPPELQWRFLRPGLLAEDRAKDLFLTLRRLYPQGFEYDLEQGGAGDCYLLAALDGLRHHPIGKWHVLNLFEAQQDEQRRWNVHFPDESSPERISPEDLAELAAIGKASKAVLGDLLIERAYARKKNRDAGNRALLTVRRGANEMDFEGGLPDEVYRDICGRAKVDVGRFSFRRDHGAARFVVPDERGHRVFSLASLFAHDVVQRPELMGTFSPDLQRKLQDEAAGSFDKKKSTSFKYPVKDAHGETHYLVGGHAYSVREVFDGGYVHVVNPHHTAEQQFVFPTADLNRHFSYLYTGRFTTA